MIAYYGSALSPNMDRTPEGYLICRNVPINRTGIQIYGAGELNLPGDPDKPVRVYRLAEDVFTPAALASFEGKDVTRGHPPEMLTAENQSGYSKGHLENVRREGDNTVADLVIKDPSLISDVENGILREVSCGYHCRFEPYQDGYKQTGIRGNHVAVVPKGRAGETVSIQDQAADQAEKGRNCMNKLVHGILTAFGAAAKDAKPEEMGELIETTASALDTVPNVLDAEPAGKAQDAEPAKEEPAAEPAKDEETIEAPKGDDIGSKLDRILEMLEAKSRGGRGEHPLHDESDLDEMIAKLSGKEEGKSITIPVEENDACMEGPAKDAAVELLKKVRPAVAAIEDKQARAKVTDALLSAIQGKDVMQDIAKAALDSAQAKAEKSRHTAYEQMCADSQSAYAARNPHVKKEG